MEEEQSEGLKVDSKKNPWKIASIALGVACLVLLFFMFKGGITGNVISGDSAGEKLVEFLNSKTNGGVSYVSSEDLGNVYEVVVLYQGEEVSVYVTKDGKYFVQGITPLTSQTAQTQDISKSDKPEVELFVMTHCPYGTQAEKGIIPALKVLGNNIDGKIRFVHYFMHGDEEEQETYRQVCIREEQGEKFLNYLECFLEAGDSSGCLAKTGIDIAKVNSCMESNAEGYYAGDSALSEGYGVRGSPTLVVNGKIVQSNRDSASYLSAICSAFNSEPGECSATLSGESPSPGFGYTGGGGGSGGSCG